MILSVLQSASSQLTPVQHAAPAPVDVTGVVNDIVLRRVGRFHRSELGQKIDKCVLRFDVDSGSGVSVCGVDGGRGSVVDEGDE